MLFNSLTFAAYLPIVFAGYWLLSTRLRAQNAFVLVASYVFYGWWDWRFLGLIVLSSLTDFVVGRRLAATEAPGARKGWLTVSLAVNLGLLGTFKYFDFFAASLVAALSSVGLDASWTTLSLVLPVGISFYTFQTLSYTIDVYRRRLEPTDDLVAFLAFVSFFPQLVAGPIERAGNLLPQFLTRRHFDERLAVDGLRQALWGLFKKVAVADTCGIVVDDIFQNYGSYSTLTLALGAFFFAMQIYGDFSGYSDMAIGVARLFGFDLKRNFAYPYFSRDIGEFWRRWHISLSTWFRDYVYIPLGGSRTGRPRAMRNIVVVFVVSGLWHGANWTFVVWGALNALYFLPLFVTDRNRANLDTVAAGRLLPSWREAASMAVTFGLTLVAWVFFRASSVEHALLYLSSAASAGLVNPLRVSSSAVGLSLLMLGWEWIQREREHGLEVSWMRPLFRRPAYLVLMWLVVEFATQQREFIYFQF